MATRTINLKTSLPGPKSKELMAERTKHVARGPFHLTPVFLAKAKGAVIEDVDGNKLLDFAAGIGVVNVGHAPDSVVKAVQAQAAEVLHPGFNVTPHESYARLAARLNAAVPGKSPKKTLLVNSGAEAVENAIKIARAYTGRQAVVCFDHAFHGRTYMALALTSKVKPYKYQFGPFNSEVYRVPFPYAYRWPTTSDPAQVAAECFERFEDVINTQISPDQVAAVILEPVLGEGGFVPAPKEFMLKLREYCTQHKIVLIADEIQSGFGRTGTMFVCEQLGIEPDLMTLAKGLGGGLPIAAVTGRDVIMDAPIDGGVGGTYGGNPVACAAALAVLDLFEKGDLLKNARQIGEVIQYRMEKWAAKFNLIGDARGIGPMRGVEFVKDRATKEPWKEAAGKVTKYAYEHGVVLLSAGTYGNVIRVLVPLVITLEQLNEGLDVIEAGIAATSKELGV